MGEHLAQVAQLPGTSSSSWLAITVPLSLSLAAFASAFGLSKAVSSALDAMARQPEASGQIQTAMIIGCALIEALTIYVLVIAFVLLGRI